MWRFMRATEIEDPERLQAFLASTATLDWSPPARAASLERLFAAVDALAQAEIGYYYRMRRRTRWTSGWTRVLAWITGTLGLLAPLVGATGVDADRAWSQWGFVLLGLAASFLAANALFEGSSGHSRFVSAQLELERRLALFRLEWYGLKARMAQPPSDESLHAAFELFRGFAGGVYATLGEETSAWVTNLQTVLKDYGDRVRLPAK